MENEKEKEILELIANIEEGSEYTIALILFEMVRILDEKLCKLNMNLEKIAEEFKKKIDKKRSE